MILKCELDLDKIIELLKQKAIVKYKKSDDNHIMSMTIQSIIEEWIMEGTLIFENEEYICISYL